MPLMMPMEERPRERMLQGGVDALSNIELLAILLGSGTKGKTVIALACEILSHFGGIKRLLEASIEELLEVKGVGLAKAIQLKSVFGLATRYLALQGHRHKIQSPKDVYFLVREKFVGQTQELLVVVLRDVRGCAFHQGVIGRGTMTGVLVHPREVFSYAIRHQAHSVVLAHNHPSGSPSPSKADLQLTLCLKDASNIVGIRLDDHLIIGENTYYSFWDKKYILRMRY